MGLKESGLRGSLRNVSVGIGAIPDSAVYYWLGESFADPWPDDVQELDMSVTGLSSTTVNGLDAVAGDGTDDHGLADIRDYAADWDGESAIEVAFETEDDERDILGFAEDGNQSHRVVMGIGGSTLTNGDNSGAIAFALGDASGNRVFFYGDSVINDGDLHSVVLNKTGNSWTGGDFEVLVDDQEETLSQHIADDDLTNIPDNWPEDMGFWGSNREGSINDIIEADVVGFGFHDETLEENTLI